MGRRKHIYYEIPRKALIIEKISLSVPELSKKIINDETVYTDTIHELYCVKLVVGSEISNIEGIKNSNIIRFTVEKEDFEKLSVFEYVDCMLRMNEGSLINFPISITTASGEIIFHKD